MNNLKNTSMNLLIIAPGCGGHHASYLYWIVTEALNREYQIYLAVPTSCLNNPLFLTLRKLADHLNRQIVIVTENITTDWQKNTNLVSLVQRDFYYYKLFSRCYYKVCKITPPDIVIIPYLDCCLHAIALLGSPFKQTPWAGIVMRPSFHYTKMGIIGPASQLLWIKEKLFSCLLHNRMLKKLWTIDEPLKHFIDKAYPLLAERLGYLPDPAEPKSTTNRKQARHALGIQPNVIIILVYGALSLRKGIAELLLAIQASNFPKHIHILLAGNQDEQIRDLLKQPFAQSLLKMKRLHQINYFLTEEEQYNAFVASDIVWLGYRQHYTMSGVIVQAGQMGLPIIACKEGLIGWLTKRYQLGITVDINDKKQIIGAINELIKKVQEKDYQKNRCHSFISHTPTNFAMKLFDSLEAR